MWVEDYYYSHMTKLVFGGHYSYQVFITLCRIKQIDSKVFEACGLAEPKPCGTSGIIFHISTQTTVLTSFFSVYYYSLKPW